MDSGIQSMVQVVFTRMDNLYMEKKKISLTVCTTLRGTKNMSASKVAGKISE
jgi:hypothetical protein